MCLLSPIGSIGFLLYLDEPDPYFIRQILDVSSSTNKEVIEDKESFQYSNMNNVDQQFFNNTRERSRY